MNNNKIVLPALTLLTSLANMLLGIGGLVIIKSVSNSLTISGLISSISSFSLIAATLFIGARIDGANKQMVLKLVTVVIAITLLIPVLVPRDAFIIVFFLSDLLMGLLSLVYALTFNGSIKQLIKNAEVDTVINRIASAKMIGIIASFGLILLALNAPNQMYIILSVTAAIYFLSFLLLFFLKWPKLDNARNGEFETINQIKKVWQHIQARKWLKNNIIFQITVSVMQMVFNGFVIYFWNEVDPGYKHVEFLLIAYGVGIGLGIIAMKSRVNYVGRLFLAAQLVISLSICAINLSIVWLAVGTASTMLGTFPLLSWAQRKRVKNTSVNIQASQESFVNFGSVILEIGLSTVAAGTFEYFGVPDLLLPFTGILMLIIVGLCGSEVETAVAIENQS